MTSPAPDLRFTAAARSDVGGVRTLNEDRVLTRDDLGLWAVADGMGGHSAGEVASQMVVDALAAVDRLGSGYAQLKAVSAALERTNEELVRLGAASRRGGVIGATVAALLVFDGCYACVWAGDSRIYRLRDGGLKRLTRDHSLVQTLVDAGELTAEAAGRHRNANIVTRAVGAAPRLELEVAEGVVQAGDLFLICSDGLTGTLSDYELGALLPDVDVEALADGLLASALERRASDNVSLVLVRAEAA